MISFADCYRNRKGNNLTKQVSGTPLHISQLLKCKITQHANFWVEMKMNGWMHVTNQCLPHINVTKASKLYSKSIMLAQNIKTVLCTLNTKNRLYHRLPVRIIRIGVKRRNVESKTNEIKAFSFCSNDTATCLQPQKDLEG